MSYLNLKFKVDFLGHTKMLKLHFIYYCVIKTVVNIFVRLLFRRIIFQKIVSCDLWMLRGEELTCLSIERDKLEPAEESCTKTVSNVI